MQGVSMSESTRRRFSLISGSLSLLANKLLLSLLAVSLIPLAITGALMYRTAVESLRSQSFKQLETVRTITAKSVERYFSSMEDQLRIMAEDRMVIDALKQFTDGYQSILREDDVDDASIELARKDLSTYYTGDFSTEYLRQTGNETAVQPLLDGLPNATAWLQDLYIRQNDNPLGSKHLLDAAGDGSSYSQAHQTFHPIFRNVLSRLGIYDFFLIDAQSGTIVYSVFKELDFATSLLNGSFSSTTFAKAYKEALSSGRRDTVAFGPFEQYLPSYEAPASFIAAPVYEGRQILGVVVFQLPIEQMNAIIGERVGMGKTGETYAVGPDRLFRSESRFTSDLGVKTTIINPKIKVDSTAVRSAIDDGQSGTAIIQDYRDQPVLSSWTPVTIHQDTASSRKTVRWALMSEIDESEVLAPAAHLRVFGSVIFGLAVLGVFAVSLGITRRLTRETRRQATLVTGIIDNTQALASSSEELTSVSQQMSTAAEETTAQANLVSAAAEQVSNNTNTVSSSIDNLVGSIHEIARSAQDAASTARQAVDLAGTTSEAMNTLGVSSEEIGKVLSVITSIAEQTNLLALNATIEAARAGEAGKGFAVVANEVKDLARETAKATEDIGVKIETMQGDSSRAVKAIGEIGGVIERINELQTKIAAAVEEQSVTTSEIGRTIGEATTGTSEIAENIVQVAQAAQTTAEGASNTQMSSHELARMAASLQQLVDDFQR